MRWRGSLSAIVLLNLIAGSAIAQAPYQTNPYQQSNYAPNWTMPALEPAWPDGQVRQQQTNEPMRYPTPQAGSQYGTAPQSIPGSSIQRQPAQPPRFNEPLNQGPYRGQPYQAQQQPAVNSQQMNGQNGQAPYADPQFGGSQFSSPQRNGGQYTGSQYGGSQFNAPQYATPQGGNYGQQQPFQRNAVGTNFYPRQDEGSVIQPPQPNAPIPAPGFGQQNQPLQPSQEQLPTPAQHPAYDNQSPGQDYLQGQNAFTDGEVGFAYGEQGGACCDTNCGVGVGCCNFFATGVLFSVEATYFKYLRSDGVRYGTSGTQEIVEFDGAIAPRFTFGYLPECYPGIRLRWFDFEDYAAGSVIGQGLGVDISVVDLELFRPIYINPYWGVEFSGGVRFASFREIMADGSAPELRINDIDAFGGVFGVQSNYRLFCGSVYTRARLAVLAGDKFHRNDNTPVVLSLNDTVVGMTEVGFGYELQHCFTGRRGCRNHTVFGRIGVEWQHWHNFSTEFVNIAPSGEDSGGPSDVGLMGLVFEAGIYY